MKLFAFELSKHRGGGVAVTDKRTAGDALGVALLLVCGLVAKRGGTDSGGPWNSGTLAEEQADRGKVYPHATAIHAVHST